MNKYVGKFCPYCKTMFLETDEVVICDICEMPHHKDCWIENGECTTFGCTGKIKDLLPFEQKTDSVSSNNSSMQSSNTIPIPPPITFTPPEPRVQAQATQQVGAFCIYCGNKNVPGDAFCRKCGKRIQAPIVSTPISKEEQDKLQYEKALKLLEAQRFDEALRTFTQLADYSDSQEKAELCVQQKELAKKETMYLSAVAVLQKQRVSDTEIKNAMSELSSILDYKDAKEKISELEKMLEKWCKAKKAADEAARKKQYDTAVSYIASGSYVEAVRILTELGDYADSKAQMEKTLETMEMARKEQLYSNAILVLSSEDVGKIELKNAIATLDSISDYKDSREKIKDVEARLEKWYEDERVAEEEERIIKEQARERAKKIAILSGVAACIIAIIVVGIVFITTPYDIIYDLDGGTIEAGNDSSYTLLTKDITLNSPTKEGYTFVGWTGTDIDTPTVSVTIAKGSLGDRSYIANWQANNYTLTFNTGGGNLGSTSATVTYDANVELPTPTKKGYTFAGWYSDSKLYSNGDWKDASDLTLTAKWTANSYTITFDDTAKADPGVVVTFNHNYSGSIPTTTKLTNGQRLSYPSNPTRNGYVFTGWYKDATCATKYNFSGNITANMTLYAGWKTLTVANSSSYPWNISGGVLTSTNKANGSTSEYRITATMPVTISFDYKTSSESGYDYLYIKKNGSQLKSCSGSTSYTSYTVTLAYGDYLSFVYSKDLTGNGGSDCAYISNITYSSTVTQTSSAKANCSTNTTYQYGRGTKYTQTVTFDSKHTLPVVTRRGYAFLGWYNGNTKVESGVWHFASDVTLTAKWEAGDNVITLDANGGTVSHNNIGVVFDKVFTLPTPTRTGYTFGGWFNGETKYVISIWNELKDITLKAKWIANEYTVAFDDTMKKEIVVTFNGNYSGATTTTVALFDGDVLTYPADPIRTDYVFTGWHTDSDCTTRYDFTGTLTDDITLYAGWKQISFSNMYEKAEIDPTDYTSSSSYLGVSTYGTSSTYKQYVYLVAEEEGTHYIYYANSASIVSYMYYLQIYNLTTGSTIKSNSTVSSTSYTSASFTCSAGDVIVITLYKYGTIAYYDSTACFYFSGFNSTTSSAIAEITGYKYVEGAIYNEQVTYGTEFTLPTLTRTGYHFLGWYNGNTKVESGDWSIASNVTLVAKCEAVKNTITLNSNGGMVSRTTIPVTYGQAYTLPTPIKTGYEFDGWYSGSAQYTSGNWAGTSDVTLVAQWTAKTLDLTLYNIVRKNVAVTYDYNYSDSPTSSTVSLEHGDILSYPPEPARGGYAFTGWYTNSSCTTRYDFTGTITDDITLYAGWRQISFSNMYEKVEINPTDYTSSSSCLGVSTYGTSSTYKQYVYLVAEEEGTHYIYYANSASSSSYMYYLQIYNLTTGSTIKSNSTVSSTSYTSASFTCSAGDVIVITLYKYSTFGNDSTACFYFSGFNSTTSSAIAKIMRYEYVEGAICNEQVTYGTEFTLPTLTRTGYHFLGWYNGYTKVNEGAWYYDSNLNLTPKWEEIVYYDVTFSNTAKRVDHINVTYDYNYSGSTNTVVALSNGDTLTYPTVPTRAGYAFGGWYTNSSCTTQYNFSEAITEDITLYAKWVSMQSSSYGSEYLNIANYTSSSQQMNITASSYSGYNYYYFTCYKYGTYTIYGTWAEGDFKVNVSNITQGTTIISDYNLYSSSRTISQSFTANAGDVICVRTTRYSSSYNYTSNGKFYVSNAGYPTSTATAQCSQSKCEYSYGESFVVSVGYGEEFTLPPLTRDGYTFLGWYYGSTKIESGVWNISSDVTLTPRWG